MSDVKSIDVVIATYNGEHTLPSVLNSLNKNKDVYWRLIIVDNNSNDNTGKIIEEWRSTFPALKLKESRQGKNYAINKALPYLKGDLVIFIDDDILVEKNFIYKYVEVVNRNPSSHIFGGRIDLFWETPPPRYVLYSSRIMAACFGKTAERQDGEINAGSIFGGNMAVRKNVFESNFVFDTGIGPNGRSGYAMGSEVEFTQRAARNGYKCYFTNGPVGYHIISAAQMTKKWMYKRAQNSGRGNFARGSVLRDQTIKTILGYPRYVCRQYFLCFILALFYFFKPNKRFEKMWLAYYHLGQMKEFYSKRKSDITLAN